MSKESVGKLVERWENDLTFREELLADPDGAARASGIELSDQDLSSLRNVLTTTTDAELVPRVSKWWLFWRGGW